MATRISDAQLAILADLAGQLLAQPVLGADQLGITRRSLDAMLAANLIERTDTGDPDIAGGRYRLHLTSTGQDELRRGLAGRLFTADRSRIGNRVNVAAYLELVAA